MDPSAPPGPWAIGLDVGGTKIAAGLVALDAGRVLARRVVPTAPARGGEAVLADALALAVALQAEAVARGGTVAGVGVGVPELVDAAGRVTTDAVIAWRGLPVRERFADLAPAAVEADVRAAALAEARLGAGRSFATFAYVTVGTGISSCLVLDGRPYAGARGGALVLASAPLSWPCSICGARSDFVLEEFASGPALAARYGRVVDRLVTNFHLPRTSLIVLVAAFMGDRWRLAYETAVDRGYRFASFGDAMIASGKGEQL